MAEKRESWITCTRILKTNQPKKKRERNVVFPTYKGRAEGRRIFSCNSTIRKRPSTLQELTYPLAMCHQYLVRPNPGLTSDKTTSFFILHRFSGLISAAFSRLVLVPPREETGSSVGSFFRTAAGKSTLVHAILKLVNFALSYGVLWLLVFLSLLRLKINKRS